MKNLDSLLNDLWTAPLSKLRDVALSYGDVAPVGDRDSKTAAPGTYRPVGDTCPSCKLKKKGCYAKTGKVSIAQRRAPANSGPSIRAAAYAMVWAARTNRVARLHVSGDFIYKGQVDVRYIEGLVAIGKWMRRRTRSPKRVNAWSYTHITRERFAPYAKQLADAGIVVRFSEFYGEMGAVVLPFERVDELKEQGLKTFKCLAQLTSSNCTQCTACWTKPEHLIVFKPHSPSKRRAAEVGIENLETFKRERSAAAVSRLKVLA